MTYEYYYNNVPGEGLCRNNLVYTSLMSQDKKTFVQWYQNDTEYHKGKNQVVDPAIMKEKWARELCWLSHMSMWHADCVPTIKDIDLLEKKIYLEVDGVDFWEQSGCDQANYDTVLPDWQEQMLNIIQTHKAAGLYKFSLHPSSYFVIDGKLKTINYFFCYQQDEGPISLKDHQSHISLNRQAQMKEYIKTLGISWDQPEPLDVLQQLCFDSFRTNYPADFIEKAKRIYD